MNIIINKQLTKKNFDKIFNYIFFKYNITDTIKILESLKLLGSLFSTKGGLSLSLSDLRIINKNRKISSILSEINKLKLDEITNRNYNIDNINSIWNYTNNFLKNFILAYLRTNDPYNQLLIALESGARGSKEQIHQIVGLRSLMVDQSGNVVPFPIKKSFIDGLSIFEYFLSSFGARKGIIDTALKTADSGYLTRRLIESSYELRIVTYSCNNKNKFSYVNKLSGISKVIIKNSILMCKYNSNICQSCFGLNYSTRNIIELGENVGILCAHSISEPSTQLTMRTFHTGGVFTKSQSEKTIYKFSGFLKMYKKRQENEILKWNNIRIQLRNHNFDFNNRFSNKVVVVDNHIENEILPIYICILSKNLNPIKLIRKNNQIYFESFLQRIIDKISDSFYPNYAELMSLLKDKVIFLYIVLKFLYYNLFLNNFKHF